MTITLRLSLSTSGEIEADSTLLTDDIENQAWSMLNDFLLDVVGDNEDITDEQYRQTYVTLLYRLTAREMWDLRSMPVAERVAMSAILEGKRYYGPPRKRKGDS